MENFPTLSQNPSYPLGESREDATIRSSFEAGYEHTRPRFTRSRKSWNVKYEMLPYADVSTLDTFITTVREGADSFVWTHPSSLVTYTVTFSEIPKFENTILTYYSVDFTLRQV